MMDYDALAKQFGSIDPSQQTSGNWMNDLSPKDQAELKMKMFQEGQKRITELSSQIEDSRKVLDDLNEFGRLNRETATGSLWDNFMPGTPILHGGNINQMQAIQSRLGPAQRPTGSGSSSDRDVSLFMGGIPSVTKEGPDNAGIREDFQRKYNYAVDKRNAMQEYINQNGTLNGFDSFWANSRNKKPAAQANKPKNKAFKLDGGGSAIGTLGADGSYYVKRGNKTYKVEE